MIDQYAVYLIRLDPTIGHEIRKSRPCVVISPNEMNRQLGTIMIAPMTTQSHSGPTRVAVRFQQKSGWVLLDQIRTIDKSRLIKKMGKISEETSQAIKSVIREMLVD